ncbi:hypothetical protein [Nocardia sp. SYP-A9097]|uniref:hypothetical protein n=1 Tax=Nocardia sp. SYP-A9097 TaxID=2663237 RepID=UPI0018918BFD|nr:hypothetical protein [Nocardia sp. SYP-A9097]
MTLGVVTLAKLAHAYMILTIVTTVAVDMGVNEPTNPAILDELPGLQDIAGIACRALGFVPTSVDGSAKGTVWNRRASTAAACSDVRAERVKSEYHGSLKDTGG